MPGMSAQGTLIARSPDPNWPDFDPVGGAVTFVDVAELRDITPPPLTRNPIETTTHNLHDDQYIVGIRRHGDMSVDVNFLPFHASHDEVAGIQFSWFEGLRDIWRLTYPSGNAWLFSGFVTGWAPSAPVDDRLSAAMTIRPTGKHDWIMASGVMSLAARYRRDAQLRGASDVEVRQALR